MIASWPRPGTSQTILADTGPLYAALDPSDQYHARAQAELARLRMDEIAVTVLTPTPFEAYTLVLRRLGGTAAHRWIDQVTRGAVVMTPTQEDYTAALTRVHAYPDQPLTLFGTLLSAVSTRLTLPVWTYDHHFDVLGAHVWRE